MKNNEDQVLETIENSVLFKNLDKTKKAFLAKNSKIETYKRDDFIFSARDDSTNFYFLKEGIVSLQMFSPERGSLTLETLKQGELIGWSWLNAPYKWKFDCIAENDVTLISFDAIKIREKMEIDHSFGFCIQKIFMNIIIDRMQSTRLRLLKELGDNIYMPDI